MKVSTVFTNGPSTQAVRIPKEFRIDTAEVWIERTEDGGLLIHPKPPTWDDFFLKTPKVSKDFSMKRDQKNPQKRDEF
jgi:antitoxin VapB